MNEKDKEELKQWIERLKSKEGAESFKKTMHVTDKEVRYEIELAQRVLFEDAQYEKLVAALTEKYKEEQRLRDREQKDQYDQKISELRVRVALR